MHIFFAKETLNIPKKPFSIAEIKKIIKPVAERYGVERVFLFGSYARGDMKSGSDIDIRIDCGAIRDFFELSGFHMDIEDALSESVDVLTTGSLEDEFLSRIANEEVLLYERS